MPNAITSQHALAGVTVRAATLLRIKERFGAGEKRFFNLCSACGLPAHLLTDPYAIIELDRYIEIFERAAALLDAPLLGAEIGHDHRAADLGPVGILFSLSPSLEVAFDRLARLLPAFQGRSSVALVREGEQSAWLYKIADAKIWPRRQDAEYAFSATCEMVRSICGPRWMPVEVRFEHASPQDPADVKALKAIFRAPVSFGHPVNALVFETDDIIRVRRPEDKDLTLILERHVSDLVGDPLGDISLEQSIQSILDLRFTRRIVSGSEIAAALGVPLRTLQRRLASDGLSLRTILLDHRMKVAAHHLAGGRISIRRLADDLGYADVTSFSRAFTRWAGHPPSTVAPTDRKK